jgi:predicted RNA binding protein YcfA (HicA-like mRNA interferase family)
VKVPRLSGKDVVKALKKAGFDIVGQKGSHVRLKRERQSKEGKVCVTIVPMHKEIAKGTLNSIIRKAGMTREEFLELL